MTKKIIFILISIFFFSSNTFSSSFPSYDMANSDTLCQDDWTERGVLDVDMYDYCMRMQFEGYEDGIYIFGQILSVDVDGYDWAADVLDYALDDWTDKGIIDYSMVAYTLESEYNDFLNVEYAINENLVNNADLSECMNTWYPAFSMVFYCLDSPN